MKACAVIPLYNECSCVESTINALKKSGCFDAVIAVDDGSKDSTWDKIKNIDGILTIRHDCNLGKARSVADGISMYDADVYVIADGDIGESAYQLSKLLYEVENGTCDLCIANIKYAKNGGGIGALKKFSKFMIKKLTGVDFPCPLSGMRAVSRRIFLDSRISLYNGYGIEVGMLIGALKNGYSVKYIDIDICHRITGRDIKGFIHRFKQFKDVLFVFIMNLGR